MTDIYFDKQIKDNEKLFLKSTELLYFAYRDYIAWPDVVLKKYSFGRAHHRIIFFVNQNPGITVAELLTLLNITKQSLSRVLSTLLSKLQKEKNYYQKFLNTKTNKWLKHVKKLALSPRMVFGRF